MNSIHRPVAIYRPLLIAAALATVSPSVIADSLNQITVEAQRKHDELQKQVAAFLNSKILWSPFDDSALLRWDSPICPLVAGANRELGEFILARLSERSREASVPLAKETCKSPNLFIIVAKEPEVFLKLWWNRNPLMYDTLHGIEPVRRFIEKSRPIRVWYNVGPPTVFNGQAISGLLSASGNPALATVDYPVLQSPSSGSLRTGRMINSVIAVIDPAQVGQLNAGQLADYLAFITFAEIDQDADTGDVPTILRVFNTPNSEVPLEMTRWDKALLRSLYKTRGWFGKRNQISQMETMATKLLMQNPTP